MTFWGGSVVRKGPPLWKWRKNFTKIDQLFIFLAKLWIFLESTVLHPLPHSKWGIVKKNRGRGCSSTWLNLTLFDGGGQICPPLVIIGLSNNQPTQGTFVQGEKLLLNHFLDAQAFLAPTPVSPSVGYTECSNLVRGLDDKEVDKVDDEVADMVVPWLTHLLSFASLLP